MFQSEGAGHVPGLLCYPHVYQSDMRNSSSIAEVAHYHSSIWPAATHSSTHRKNSSPKSFVSVYLAGYLGNQMFRYAVGEALALRWKVPLYILQSP